MMVREPVQSLESWARGSFQKEDYIGVVNRISTMLFDIDKSVYSKQKSIGVRLEDLKKKPEETIPALCKWMGITEEDSLYQMTVQGKKWWEIQAVRIIQKMAWTHLENFHQSQNRVHL